MRVLVLSSVFPNAAQPTLGAFVRARAAEVARLCELTVVAPLAWFPFNRVFRGAERTDIPRFERQEGLRVHHPRFFSVPGVLKSLDGLFYFLSLVPAVRRLRREFRFDVIDAHFAYPDGMAACLLGRLFRCPVTVTLRGTIVPLSRYRLRRRQIVWTLRQANRVIAVSQSLKDVAVSLGIDPEKIRVIPNGIDTTTFRRCPGSETRKAFGLPENRTIVISVGSLSLRKGHQRVLEALPDVLAKRPDALYVVVGGPGVEGDTGPLLTRMIQELGLAEHVRLVGARPHSEIPDWLNAADVFCLASSNEGRANAVIEALASGVPVVTTRVGGHAEVVRDAHNGFLVEPGDRDGLARGLVAAMDTDWDRAAIASDWLDCSWERTATAVLGEFERVVTPTDGGAAMAGGADESKLSGMLREWDELAQRVGSDNDTALRGSGATTFLKGGQVDTYERVLESEVEFVATALAVTPSERVLEVGCGNCVFLSRLTESAGLTVGIDLSHGMLCHGRRRLEREGKQASAHLVQAAMQDLPFKPGTFDKILLYACLQYVPSSELPLVLKKIAEVKTPGGLVLFGSLPTRTCLAQRRAAFIQLLRNTKRGLLRRPPVSYWRFSVDRLRRQLEQAGLMVVAEGTTGYNFFPLPTAIATRLRRRYEERQKLSRLFSSRYYFLCR